MGISRQQALDCLRSDDLIGIGMEADAIRRRLHPEGVVTYRCIYETDGSVPTLAPPPHVTALRIVCADLETLRFAVEHCRLLRKGSDALWLEISVPLEAASDPRIHGEISRWAECGVNSIAVDTRKPGTVYATSFASSMELHRRAHAGGMSTTVSLPFGGGEELTARLDLLDAVRRLQEELGGFVALVPQAIDTPTSRDLDAATAVDRLKMLAVARMYLDNIQHIQSPQVGSGLKVLQTGLLFGADDAELRLPQRDATEQDLRRVIRDAGLMPVERNGAYTTVFLN